VTIGEFQAGIEHTREQEAAKAGEIECWLDQLCNTLSILTMDGPAVRRWAQLMHRQSGALYEEARIGAIANVNQLTLVTRHVGDYNRFAVPLFDPSTGKGY
jgi:predicted nucleic acid-binding protein